MNSCATTSTQQQLVSTNTADRALQQQAAPPFLRGSGIAAALFTLHFHSLAKSKNGVCGVPVFTDGVVHP
jgi:hypothetical protein